MPVLDHRIRHLGIATLVSETDLATADERETALPVVPAEVGTGRNETDLFYDVLADVGDQHVAGGRVPGKALGVTHAQGVDLAERVTIASVHEWIIGGNAILAVGAVGAQRVDTQDFAEG